MSLKTWWHKRQLNKIYNFNKQQEVWLPAHRYNNVFVFGSNLLGKHIGGAALTAKVLYQAQDGIAQGPTGNCYAIPTVDDSFGPLSLIHIGGFVMEFKKEAEANPDVMYHLTPIGCGIAGYKVDDIAPMFLTMPKNVILPIEFQEFFLKEWFWYKDFFNERIENEKRNK